MGDVSPQYSGLKSILRAEKYIHELLNRDEFSASLLIKSKDIREYAHEM